MCVGGQVSLAPIGMGVTAHGDTKVMTGTDFVSLSTALGWSENQKQLLAGGRGLEELELRQQSWQDANMVGLGVKPLWGRGRDRVGAGGLEQK